jgi:hypothetical protein
MQIYSHRVNTISGLKKIDPVYGVEIDLRTKLGELILSHDPYADGELFSEWLKHLRGHSLILNVKEDALEDSILELLAKNGVSDYFFLDQSFPSIRRCINMGITKVATRVSDFEDLETALRSGSEWVWLDSFSGVWDHLLQAVPAIAMNGQKTCLVSPELQRLDSIQELTSLKEMISSNRMAITSVCTKFPESWET